jgi:hypothetical protein
MRDGSIGGVPPARREESREMAIKVGHFRPKRTEEQDASPMQEGPENAAYPRFQRARLPEQQRSREKMTIRSLKRTLTGEVRAELLALTALGAALVIGAIPAQAAQVLDVRVGRHVDFTRVVFELDAATGYRIERHEPAPGVSELVVSLEATSKPLELKASNSLIEGVALEPRGSENSIARIRLKESGLHLKQMTLVNPPRIVVDVLRPKSKAPAPAASKTPRRTAKTPDKPAPGAPAKLGAAARETEKTAAPAQSQGAEPSAIPRESQPEQTSRPAAPPVPSPARDQRPARVVAPAAESAPAAKPDQPGEPSEGAMVEGGDEPQQLAMVKQPAAQGEGAAPRPARVTPREPARPPPARTQSPRPSGGPMAAARASRSDSGDSLFSPMNLGLAAAGVLFLGGGAFFLLRRRGGDSEPEEVDQENPFAELAEDESASASAEAPPGAEGGEEAPSGDSFAASNEPDLFDDSPPKGADMDQVSGFDVTSATSSPPTAAGVGGSEDVMRLVRELERRVASLETRLDEVVDSRERLERQVAAQTEELRVQRAAIARTQRAVRNLSRPDEENITEPALRNPEGPES